MRLIAAALLLTALPALAAPGGNGPEGRYVIDVEGTYQALVAADAAKPDSRATLEQQKGVMILVFRDDTLSFVTGPGLGNSTRGTCHWTLTGDALAFDRCRAAGGGAFTVDGIVLYDAATGAVTVQGNTPVPMRYITE
ncbi:hypothetical protein [Zavarzinia compransoris]|uniref:Uncharacterized protein n=1 Tax=Zavarzinia compransoris TaxID=1264899 RepID=A0A317E6L8_9PROT|nr:hypothetical protein [Zavarzinia compransoris]PWR20705.1 hypothetical protein DKG75_11960 [Zavarzinia compransoris]TDP44468.1 hypothetical protein DES42_107236 [Zavarzinia compransoris]